MSVTMGSPYAEDTLSHRENRQDLHRSIFKKGYLTSSKSFDPLLATGNVVGLKFIEGQRLLCVHKFVAIMRALFPASLAIEWS
jgi:hypothetical protein